MDKFEELMLKISRIFGLIIMTITLLAITLVVVVKMGSYISDKFEKSVPDVKFYKSDFLSPQKKDELKKDEIRPDSEDQIMARDVIDELKPLFEKRLDAYLSENAEKLFSDEETRDEKKKEFRNKRIRMYMDNSVPAMRGLIRAFDKKFKDDYKEGLVDYLQEADKDDVEVFTANGVPLSNIAYTRPSQKFTAEFKKQMWEIVSRDKKSGGWESMLVNSVAYISLFFMITIFLFVGVMFAILRIEKKM